ncbi:MAG: TetR/AcrR family transcriptional regulator [bacterium]
MQERVKRTKSKILQAAQQEFSDKGFHGARMDSIAEKAGINKQRIYAYFKNKENLFCEVLKGCFQLIADHERVFTDLLEKDIPHLEDRILRYYMSFHEKYPHFWRLIAWENLDGGKRSNTIRGIREQPFRHLKNLYQKGQKQGIYKKEVSFEAFIFLLSAVSFFYYSNQKTMSQTLNVNLFNTKIQDKLVREILLLLHPQSGKS